MKFLLVALLVALSPGVLAQAVTDEPVKKPVTKKVVPKKSAPPKKPATPKKAEAPTSAPVGRVYTNDPRAPTLYDKQGSAIPTNPNAYDVSSAVGKK